MQDEWQKKKLSEAKVGLRPIPPGWSLMEFTVGVSPYNNYKGRKILLYAPTPKLTPEERWERLNSLIAVVS